MAENNDGWFGSWLNAAKNKSTEVLEFVKKDLEEFGTVVKNEATSVVSSTGSAIEKTFQLDSPDSTASSMKRSFSSFLGQINTVLNPSPDDSETEVILIGENSETVALTKLQQAIFDLQQNKDTFLSDPEASLAKQFECWLEIIDDQLSIDRLEKHLNSSTLLKNQYSALVPDLVEHSLFWKRYLFKKALLEDDIAREEALEKREQNQKVVTEESLKWEQEDFANDIELTEEEQIKLLEQYENETKTKKSPVKKAPIGENVVFKQETPTKKIPPKKTQNKIENGNTDKTLGKNTDKSTNKPTSKTNKAGSKSKITKEAVAEKKLDNKENVEKKLEEKENVAEKNPEENKNLAEKKLDKTESAASLDTPSSNSSSDGDWEKIGEVEK